jgi:DNA repair protein RecN (Recombination protein N)
MLDELRVRDIALIEDASLEFSPGFTVLTGETGAGKTALLAAVKLLVGERGDSSMVRDGAKEARVEARFTVAAEPTAAKPAAAKPAAAKPSPCPERIASRRLGADGRSKCTLDDQMVTVGALAEHIGPLIDLHGQHEHQALLKPAAQLACLDRFAGAEVRDALAVYQEAFGVHAAACEQVEQLAAAAQTSAFAIEQAQFTLREITQTDPQPGEYEQLEEQLPRLRNGEDLAQASNAALKALRSEGGALEALGAAQHELARFAGIDARLDALAAQLESLSIGAEDLAAEFRDYRDSVEFDPQALEQTLDRLGQLEGLRKRFGPRMEDVFATWQTAQQTVELTESLEERQAKAQQALAAAQQALQEAAEVLGGLRAQASTVFSAALSAAVQDLAMEGAAFQVAITALAPGAWTLQGSKHYEILYQPSAGSTPRPLAKIASGGELSRVMLALKTLLGEADPTVTLVFDEIDAGIGGATATAVAQRLAQLARTHQLIVVTHLAQIAAVADSQWVVRKTLQGDVAQTSITPVTGEKRTAELARMLAGSTDATALEHARQLLEQAV